VPAEEIEALVAKSARAHLGRSEDKDNASVIRNHVVRVEIQPDRLNSTTARSFLVAFRIEIATRVLAIKFIHISQSYDLQIMRPMVKKYPLLGNGGQRRESVENTVRTVDGILPGASMQRCAKSLE
jgi:hypothetical protein